MRFYIGSELFGVVLGFVAEDLLGVVDVPVAARVGGDTVKDFKGQAFDIDTQAEQLHHIPDTQPGGQGTPAGFQARVVVRQRGADTDADDRHPVFI